MKHALIHADNLTINIHQEAANADPFNLFLRRSILSGAADAVAAAIATKSAPAPEGTVINPTTGLMRAINPFGDKRFTTQEAIKACADLRIGGFSDWHLVTLKEGFAMTDHKFHHPAVDPNEYPDIVSDVYCTSTVDPESPSVCAFCLVFAYGAAYVYNQDYRGRALAVRSVVAAPAGQ